LRARFPSIPIAAGHFFDLIVAFCFLLPFHLAAQASISEEKIIVDADHVNYDGKSIVLTGNAVVDHELGTLAAQEIHLRSLPGEKSFSELEMRDRVAITFKEGGSLSCSQASLDYRTQSGVFSGSVENEYVTYAENCRGKKQETIPLIVKSRQMSLKLAKENAAKSKTPSQVIKEIIANDTVTLSYNHDYIITSDDAVYHRDSLAASANAREALCGLIVMHAAEEGHCQITNRQGDVIRAVEIMVDTIKRQITLNMPRGTFQRMKDTNGIGCIDFTADILVWDEGEGKLVLRDNVKVNQKGMGNLQTAKELRIFQKIVDGQKSLSAIETDEDTILTYSEDDQTLSYMLTCYGPMKVDHQKMETKLYSPKDSGGCVPENKQVFFEDAKGEIYADKALIQYRCNDHAVIPYKVILVGNVRIFNRLNASDDDAAAANQYALADRVDFFPSTKEMVFKAAPGHRVLFFDKVNNLEVSAPAVKIIRDRSATKEAVVQGMGDVRFSFLEHEFEQLRSKFLIDKSKEGDAQASPLRSHNGEL
jgi:lipopolysaccharide export system protein LptA